MPLENENIPVRQSIIGALKEHAEKGDDNARQTINKLDKRQADLAELNGREVEEKADKVDTSEASTEENQPSQAEAAGDETPQNNNNKSKSGQEPHAALPKSIKDDWSKLSPATRDCLNKLEKDINDTKAETGRLKAEYERGGYAEIERVINHYIPKEAFENAQPILDRRTGQLVKPSPAQTVSQLFNYLDGLSNPETALRTFIEIGANFGIDPKEALGGNSQDWRQQRDAQANSIHPVIDQVLESKRQEYAHMQQQAVQQYHSQVKEAEKTTKPMVSNWSKDKPHFEKVKSQMGQILEAYMRQGLIRDKVSNEDLTLAYETACKLQKLSLTKPQNQQQKKQNSQPTRSKETAFKSTIRAAMQAQKD